MYLSVYYIQTIAAELIELWNKLREKKSQARIEEFISKDKSGIKIKTGDFVDGVVFVVVKFVK